MWIQFHKMYPVPEGRHDVEPVEVGGEEVRAPGAPGDEGRPEGGGRDTVQRKNLQKAPPGYESTI